MPASALRSGSLYDLHVYAHYEMCYLMPRTQFIATDRGNNIDYCAFNQNSILFERFLSLWFFF